MSATFLINHPEKDGILVLRESDLIFCENDPIAAGLTSFLRYWHEVKLKQQRKKPKDKRSDLDLLQFHTEKQLLKKLFFITKTPACLRRAIKFLEKKGVISIHPNPNKRYGFDRTRHFMFYPEALQNNGKFSVNSKNKPKVEKTQSTALQTIDAVENDEKSKPIAEVHQVSNDLPITEAKAANKNTQAKVSNTPRVSIPADTSSEQETELVFDFALKDFSLAERAQVFGILQDLNDKSLQQSILDECNQGLATGKINNLFSYLAALVKRANEKKFFSTADLTHQRTKKAVEDKLITVHTQTPTSNLPHDIFPTYPQWKQKQEEMKALLKLSNYMSFVLPVRAYHSEDKLFLRCINVHSKNFLEKNLSKITPLFGHKIKLYIA
jgi:hypothetical protein